MNPNPYRVVSTGSLVHKLRKLVDLCTLLIRKSSTNIQSVISTLIAIMHELCACPNLRRKLVTMADVEVSFMGSCVQKTLGTVMPGKVCYVARVKEFHLGDTFMKRLLGPSAHDFTSQPNSPRYANLKCRSQPRKKKSPPSKDIGARNCQHMDSTSASGGGREQLLAKRGDKTYMGWPLFTSTPARLFPHFKDYPAKWERICREFPSVYGIYEYLTLPDPAHFRDFADIYKLGVTDTEKYTAIVNRAHALSLCCVKYVGILDVPTTRKVFCCECFDRMCVPQILLLHGVECAVHRSHCKPKYPFADSRYC